MFSPRNASPATARRAKRITPAAQRRSFYLQPDHDPLAHAEDAEEFKRALGDRVTIMKIANASHAAVAEQPDAIAVALIEYARKL